jgi:hypothetical protein
MAEPKHKVKRLNNNYRKVPSLDNHKRPSGSDEEAPSKVNSKQQRNSDNFSPRNNNGNSNTRPVTPKTVHSPKTPKRRLKKEDEKDATKIRFSEVTEDTATVSDELPRLCRTVSLKSIRLNHN